MWEKLYLSATWRTRFVIAALCGLAPASWLAAQFPFAPGGPPGGGRGPGGMRGPGGPMDAPEIKLVAKYDANGDGWLNRDERDAARSEAEASGGRGRGFGGGFGGGFGPPPAQNLAPPDGWPFPLDAPPFDPTGAPFGKPGSARARDAGGPPPTAPTAPEAPDTPSEPGNLSAPDDIAERAGTETSPFGPPGPPFGSAGAAEPGAPAGGFGPPGPGNFPPGDFGPGFGPPDGGPGGFGPGDFGGPPPGGFGGPPAGGFGGGFGPPGFGPGGPQREPASPGQEVAPADVRQYGDEPLYDRSAVRTLFLTFASDDWEAEMEAFRPTDVEVDATLETDGHRYELVGVGFRGASSYGMVPTGSKRSLNISLDMAHRDQRLLGYKSLNLLNSNGDPTFMHAVLYSAIANKYLPTPRVNLVRVVINGEDWGLYQNAQQFDKLFLREALGKAAGTRWKVPGRPQGGGSLAYLGDDVEAYRRLYEIKGEDTPEAWRPLIELCRVLNETPLEDLPQALPPLVDVDGILRLLAVEMALINNDGYWVRGSDYSLFRDAQGQFHLFPHDMNEAFTGAMGPGMGGPGMGGPGMGGPGRGGRGGPFSGPGGPGGGGGPGSGAAQNPYDLDPLVGLDNPDRPLRSRLLQVPAWRTKYLRYVGEIARNELDWQRLGPLVAELRGLAEPLVEVDTRKLSSLEAFQTSTSDASPDDAAGRRSMELRRFADQRRAYLLAHPEVQAALAEASVE